MTRMTSDENYLKLFEIGYNKYLVGVYQSGFTIYKQQIRALNLFNALIKTGKLKLGDKESTIGIIGGGAAGLTVAAAALKANINVTLIEKERLLMPMQHNSSRKVHPSIYDWPDENSLHPVAKLPVLSWSYGEAGTVRDEILRQFKLIQDELAEAGKFMYTEHLECKSFTIEHTSDGRLEIKLPTKEVKIYSKGYGVSHTCDIIIYAIGFGIEEHTPGYWQSDTIDQIDLKHYTDFIVSGVGDGGLTDALRLMISDYNYEFVTRVIKPNTNYSRLIEQLSAAKSRALKGNGNIYQEFKKINSNYYKYILDAIKAKHTGKIVHLHSRELDFDHILNIKKVSLLNAFLVFILRKEGLLDFLIGNLVEISNGVYNLDGKPLSSFLKNNSRKYFVFKRHGADRNKMVAKITVEASEALGFANTIEKIKKAQEEQDTGFVEPRWTYNQIYNAFDQRKLFAYCPSSQEDGCVEYASNLYINIKKCVGKRPKFRLTLHKVIEFEGTPYFQQIVPYFGYDGAIDKSNLGRIFPANRGNVGFSINHGEPCLIVNKNKLEFKKLVKALNLSHIYDKIKMTKSFFTLPILAPVSKGKYATNLILYIDCMNDPDFFIPSAEIGKQGKKKRTVKNISQLDVLDLIYALTESFIEKLELSINSKSYMYPNDFRPTIAKKNAQLPLIKNNKAYVMPDKLNDVVKNSFRFKNFYSFDAVPIENNVF